MEMTDDVSSLPLIDGFDPLDAYRQRHVDELVVSEGADAYWEGAMYEQCPYVDHRRELWQEGWLREEARDADGC